MKEYTQEQIDEALILIEQMSQMEMCRIWRFAPEGSAIYLRSDLPTGDTFKDRLFNHFGGFSPEISKQLGFLI